MKKKLIFAKISVLCLVVCIVHSCNSFAQNTKSAKDKKKSHTEYIQLKIEKDDNGKVTKIDTVFSSSEFSFDNHMKSFSVNIPDIEDEMEKIDKHMKSVSINISDAADEIEKSFEFDSENDKDIDPWVFFKNFHLNANDSFVNMNIMNKIRIECNGKEGKESVRIFAGDDEESWVEKIYNKTMPDKKGQKQKSFVIKIDDDGVEINGEKEKGSKNKKCKIYVSKVIIDDATNDEKKIADKIDDGQFKELDIEDLNFSPNPGNGKFNLEFELEKKGDVEIKIVDLNGKELFKENLQGFKGNYKKDIDISDNGKGIYLINIKQDNRKICKKIVIQ